MQIELSQSELFVKSGLVEQFKEVRSELFRSEIERKSRFERSSGTARYDSEYNMIRSSELYKNAGLELRDDSLLYNEI